MIAFANPARFLGVADALRPWAAGFAAVLLAAGLYLSLFLAPPDYQQGEAVRIMYVHVPSAWMALFVYAVVAGASATGFIWKVPVADMVAKAAAPIGAWFTFLALVTGSIWGKPMWGAWWVWDARLTSVLILLFLYLGYMGLWRTIEEPVKAAKASAILAMVGVVNLPVIKFSVDWWNTLHQPASISRLDTPAIHASMLVPLLVMAAGFMLFFLAVLLVRVRMEILSRRLYALQLNAVGRMA